MATTTTEIRRRFLDAVAGKDVRAVVECYAPDAVLTAPEGRFEGHDYYDQLELIEQLGITATAQG
jgi:ketosteroid isomerase-like protein